MLHQGGKPIPLTESQLRQTIEDAIAGRKGVFLYDPDLLGKLASRNVTIQDLLHVCHTWQAMTPQWDNNYSCWRYALEGPNTNGKWMKAVVAHNTVPNEELVAITGFRYARGKKP